MCNSQNAEEVIGSYANALQQSMRDQAGRRSRRKAYICRIIPAHTCARRIFPFRDVRVIILFR